MSTASMYNWFLLRIIAFGDNIVKCHQILYVDMWHVTLWLLLDPKYNNSCLDMVVGEARDNIMILTRFSRQSTKFRWQHIKPIAYIALVLRDRLWRNNKAIGSQNAGKWSVRIELIIVVVVAAAAAVVAAAAAAAAVVIVIIITNPWTRRSLESMNERFAPLQWALPWVESSILSTDRRISAAIAEQISLPSLRLWGYIMHQLQSVKSDRALDQHNTIWSYWLASPTGKPEMHT